MISTLHLGLVRVQVFSVHSTLRVAATVSESRQAGPPGSISDAVQVSFSLSLSLQGPPTPTSIMTDDRCKADTKTISLSVQKPPESVTTCRSNELDDF